MWVYPPKRAAKEAGKTVSLCKSPSGVRKTIVADAEWLVAIGERCETDSTNLGGKNTEMPLIIPQIALFIPPSIHHSDFTRNKCQQFDLHHKLNYPAWF